MLISFQSCGRSPMASSSYVQLPPTTMAISSPARSSSLHGHKIRTPKSEEKLPEEKDLRPDVFQ